MKIYSLLILLTLTLRILNAQQHSQIYVPFCNIEKTNIKEIQKILGEIIDDVGYYTLLADLKPCSRIELKSFDKFERGKNCQKRINQKTVYYQRILDQLSDSVIYFKFVQCDGYRIINSDTIQMTWMPYIIVINRKLVQNVIHKKEDFFKSIGITKNTSLDSIASLFAIKENIYSSFGNKYVQAEGYLYGYPDYAVDFFINRNNKKSNSVSIPVYNKKSTDGFYYISSCEYKNEDQILFTKAENELNQYTETRKKYKSIFGFDAITLIQDYYKNNPSR